DDDRLARAGEEWRGEELAAVRAYRPATRTMNSAKSSTPAKFSNRTWFRSRILARTDSRHAGSFANRSAVSTYCSVDAATQSSICIARYIACVNRPRRYGVGIVTTGTPSAK